MLRYMVRGPNCVVVCGVFVPANYLPNIVAGSDMSYDFIYGMFWREIALFGFLGSGRI